MLVQGQKKRDDGWWYGFALDDDDADDAITTPEIPLKEMAEALKQDLYPETMRVYTTASRPWPLAACKKVQDRPERDDQRSGQGGVRHHARQAKRG